MTVAKNAFIMVFLGIQLLLPIRGFVYDKYETRGNFSWNMYSKRYRCRVDYTLHKPDGETEDIPHREFFHRSSRSSMVYHRDHLPLFHEFLCEEYRERGELGSITGKMHCQLNFGPRVHLVERGVDICTAENYGVK